MTMIFFDVETTGLIENEARPLSQQPRIIQIGMVICAPNSNELDTFETYVNPECSLSPEITKITGITNGHLINAPTFVEVLSSLIGRFLGCHEVLAHNARFDQMMLVFELRRLGKEFAFPYPPRWTNTMTLFPGKLQDWGRMVKGDAFTQAHTALNDARLLRDCWLDYQRKSTEGLTQ